MIRSLACFRTRWSIVWSIALAQMQMLSRYRGWLLLDIILPTIMAGLPILLGRATAGPSAADNFRANTGTSNYVAYFLIGSNIYMIVNAALWNIGFWLRREQQTGTLESLYLAPTDRWLILSGLALYTALRSLVSFSAAFSLGCLLFRVNPLQGNILLALGFLVLGMSSLYGMSLFYGALVLKLKEASALMELAQWVVSLLMGVYFPVTVFPLPLRVVAWLFPPAWMNNGVRAALLDVGWFCRTWYADMAVLAAFCLIMPVLGYQVFRGVERRLKANEGIGQF